MFLGVKQILLIVAFLLFFNLALAQPYIDESSSADSLETSQPEPENGSLDNEQSETPQTEPQDDEDLLQQSFETFVETRSTISENIYSLSDNIDSFFGDERIEENTRNRSRIRLNISSKFSQGGEISNDAAFSTVLVLPRTQRNLQLIVDNLANEDDEEKETDGTEDQNKNQDQEDEEPLFSAALRYIFLDSEDWKIHTDSGVHVKLPLESFVKLKIRRTYIATPWIIRATQIFEWTNIKGWGESTRVNFDRRFAEEFLFRFSNKVSWLRKDDIFNFRHVLSVSHKISLKDAFTYFAGIRAQDKPVLNLTSYDVGVTYRRRLYQNWLFGEIEPVVAFPRSRDFKSTPSLKFKIEVVFGG